MTLPTLRVRTLLPQWRAVLARLFDNPVTRNSTYIMLSTVITSLLGFVYWIVVVRTAGIQVSGDGAATTSALMAAALMSSVGAAAAMVEWLPRAQSEHEWRRRLTVGLFVAGVTGVVAGAIGAVLLGWTTRTLPDLRHPAGFAWFCAGSVVFGVATVLDYAAVAAQRAGLLLMRTVLFTALRIPIFFLPVLVWHTTNEVLASWVVSATVSLVVAVVRFERQVGRSLRPTIGSLGQDLREMAGSLLGQHFITITAMLSAYLLPILVVSRLDATHASYFYATWMLCAVFFMISPAIATSLFAAAAADPHTLPATARHAGKLIAVLLAAPMACYLFAGDLLLQIFGAQYASHGRTLMILLTLSAIPDAVTNIAVSVLRATHRLSVGLWLNTTMLLTCLALSWLLLPRFGIAAVGFSWLASQTAGAIWVGLAWRRIVHPVQPAPPARHRSRV